MVSIPLEHAGHHCPRRIMRVKMPRCFLRPPIYNRTRTAPACRTISTDSRRGVGRVRARYCAPRPTRAHRAVPGKNSGRRKQVQMRPLFGSCPDNSTATNRLPAFALPAPDPCLFRCRCNVLSVTPSSPFPPATAASPAPKRRRVAFPSRCVIIVAHGSACAPPSSTPHRGALATLAACRA